MAVDPMLARTREHLRLGDDEYGRLIKGGLERLEQQLAPG